MNRYVGYISKILISVLLLSTAFFAYAQSDEIEDLSRDIDDKSQDINSIDVQIAADKKKLNQLQGEKNSLEKTITNLNYSRNKLTKEIYNTEGEITETDQEIKDLSGQITDLQDEIILNKIFIKETIVEINKTREKSFWEIFLLYRTFSEYLDRIAHFETTGKVLKEKIDEVLDDKERLQKKSDKKEDKKVELKELTEQLSDKKQVVEITKKKQQQVLSVTKNSEKIYQQTLSEKLELKRQFEQALLELESKLQIAIDKSLFASKSQGLFSWPVTNFRITQFFGNTSFAKSGAYNGRGHNGTDLAVPTGTPVRAVMDGTVWSQFDTGSVGARGSDGKYRACVSYGKYVLIKHDNGLSTLVAHNSLIKVKNGQRVKRGDIIAYSGNTGYSTGPHLHLSVYASQGIQIKRLGDVSSTTYYCADSVIPIIPLNAYLDPWDYLPRPKFNIGTSKHGQSSGAISSMQMMLKHERIFPNEVSANGYYGDVTAKAVEEWQKKYGLGSTDGKSFNSKSVNRYNLLFK